MSSEEIKPIIELILSESGKGMIWIMLAAGVAGALSLMAIAVGFVIAFRSKWPSEERWGHWCRIGFLVHCIITLPSAAAFTGGIWGASKALKTALDENNLVEKASVEALNPIVAQGYVAFQNYGNTNKVDIETIKEQASQLLADDPTLDLKKLKDLRDTAEADVLNQLAEKFTTENPDGAERSLTQIITDKVWHWLAEKKTKEIFAKFDEAVTYVEQFKGDDDGELKIGAISEAAAHLFIKPKFDQFYKDFSKLPVKFFFFEMAILTGIPLAIIEGLIIYQKKKAKHLEEPVPPDTPVA